MTIILQLPSFLDTSFVEHGSYLLRSGKPVKKPLNLMREIEEENWGTIRTF